MKTIKTRQDVLNLFEGKIIAVPVTMKEAGDVFAGRLLIGSTDKAVYNELCDVMEGLNLQIVLHPMIIRDGRSSIYKVASVYEKSTETFLTASSSNDKAEVIDAREVIFYYSKFLSYQESLKKVEVKDMSIDDQRKTADKLSIASEIVDELFGQCRCDIKLLLESDKKDYPLEPLSASKRGYIQADTDVNRSIWWNIDGTILIFIRGIGSFCCKNNF